MLRFTLAALALVGSAVAFAPVVPSTRIAPRNTAMHFFGGGNKAAEGGTADGAKRVAAELKNPVVLFTTSSCPYCKKAKSTLDGIGASYKEVQCDKDPDGKAIRAELKKVARFFS